MEFAFRIGGWPWQLHEGPIQAVLKLSGQGDVFASGLKQDVVSSHSGMDAA